ncbi:DUF2062 domain-containing protein [Rhizobium sp. Root482]|uniref:DUF2062 domain-containing protein n=1 Tax=Rhizobium sp. Root482 TaxID=1736543 RepID=UPI0006FFC17B|nr:DUF2062 domain-containing protein [Rhizobium sp. Root482]KQY20104.1 hypothetical protein ASD31_04715 [Rhizobium sp. Root482]
MLFRRKRPATRLGRIREFLWPRKGFSRGLRYLSMRVIRLSSSPHSIAVGVAAGAAASATPFIGFHILIALALAYAFSGNLLAAGLSTALANPVTIPVIFAAVYEVGTALSGAGGHGALSGRDILHMLGELDLSHLWGPVLKPMLIGTVPLAAASALIFYVAAFHAASLYQARRRSRRSRHVQASTAGPADAT